MATEIQACGDKAINEIDSDIKDDTPVLDEIKRNEVVLKEIEELKKITSQDKNAILNLEQKLKEQAEEIAKLKAFNVKIVEENAELKKTQSKNILESQEVTNLKKHSEELLTRAKDVIFEKTKVCKNQELQIEALTQQVVSLKEVVSITKDLLEIRNVELKHLTGKLDGMEEKIKCEKERHQLMHSKMEKMMQMNAELKTEYETQLKLFSVLRDKYHEKEVAQANVNNLQTECCKKE